MKKIIVLLLVCYGVEISQSERTRLEDIDDLMKWDWDLNNDEQNASSYFDQWNEDDLEISEKAKPNYEQYGDVVKVDPSSKHCKENAVFGLSGFGGISCVYSDTNATVLVPPQSSGLGIRRGTEELEIHNASKIVLLPSCYSWIQVFNSENLQTDPGSNDHYYYSDYEHSMCQTWLRLYHSTAVTIKHGVRDLSLMSSKVDKIRLSRLRDFTAVDSEIGSIESLSVMDESFKGQIVNTTIGNLSQALIASDFTIQTSQIELLNMLYYMGDDTHFSMENIFIDKILYLGLGLMSGHEAVIRNLTINYAEAAAILIDEDIHVELENVHIKEVEANSTKPSPVFLAKEDCSNVVFRNVSVNGTLVENCSSPHIEIWSSYLLERNHWNEPENERPDIFDACVREAGRMECDCGGLVQKHGQEPLPFASDERNLTITITNCTNLNIAVTCPEMLQIFNSTVNLLHIKDVHENITSCDSKIELISTEIEELSSGSAHLEDIKNHSGRWSLKMVNAKLKLMKVAFLDNVLILNSTIKFVKVFKTAEDLRRNILVPEKSSRISTRLNDKNEEVVDSENSEDPVQSANSFESESSKEALTESAKQIQKDPDDSLNSTSVRNSNQSEKRGKFEDSNAVRLETSGPKVQNSGGNANRIVFKNSQIDKIENALFLQAANLYNVHIGEIKHLALNHAARTSYFTNSTIRSLNFHSILVEGGRLILEDNDIQTFLPEGIFLEPGAHLSVKEEDPWPVSAFEFVSVYHRSQVAIEMPIIPEIEAAGLNWYIHIEKPHTAHYQKLSEVLVLNSTTTTAHGRAQMCQRKGFFLFGELVCDLSGNDQTSIDIIENFDAEPQFKKDFRFEEDFGLIHLELRNAKLVNVFHTAFTLITLKNIEQVNFITEEEESKKHSDLQVIIIENSAVDGLYQRPNLESLFLQDVAIEHISLRESVQEVYLKGAEIKLINEIHCRQRVSINASHIYVAKGISSQDELLINNSKFDVVGGFGISANFKSVIEGSTFRLVKHYGIVVYGKLSIVNTIFEKLVRNSIYLEEGGSLRMENITIREGSLKVFNIGDAHLNSIPNVMFKNVSINGRHVKFVPRLHWSDDFHSSYSEETRETEISTAAAITLNSPSSNNNSSEYSTQNSSVFNSSTETIANGSDITFNAQVEVENKHQITISWAGILLGILVGSLLTVGGVFIFQNVRRPLSMTSLAQLGSYRWKPSSGGNSELIAEEELTDWTVQQTHAF